MIDAAPLAALAEYRLQRPELLQVKTRDGFVMEAMLIKPPGFDPSRRYPVLQSTYAGPHAPRVKNAWGDTAHLFLQLIAQQGVLVWVCDNRTASGKGAVSAWHGYKRMGVTELEDIEDGLAWLRSQPFVDPARIGIEGWSYGGFMVSYALTHSTSFAMGIAGGPVTDWRLYDSVYTERYMGLPARNEAGYADTAPRRAAASLHGRLLLVHGAIDDNVHPQNTLQFAHELQKAGKPFRMMLYPKARHGVTDPAQLRHLRGLMLDFIEETLLGVRPASHDRDRGLGVVGAERGQARRDRGSCRRSGCARFITRCSSPASSRKRRCCSCGRASSRSGSRGWGRKRSRSASPRRSSPTTGSSPCTATSACSPPAGSTSRGCSASSSAATAASPRDATARSTSGSSRATSSGMISHLGAMLPVADGLALAAQLKGTRQVAATFTGDGATSEGDFHEAVNLAAVWKLPVLFVIENNCYGLSTPANEQYACRDLADRGVGYGIPGQVVDGNDLLAVLAAVTDGGRARAARRRADAARVQDLPHARPRGGVGHRVRSQAPLRGMGGQGPGGPVRGACCTSAACSAKATSTGCARPSRS